jgi:phage terminase small subunit
MSTPITPKEAAAAALKILSPQQRKFVLAYCDTFNATKAALAAKYSEKTARQQGSRLLTNVDIKAAVKAVLATASMEPEEIAARWTLLARAGLDDFYTMVEVEETTKVQQPLAKAIALIEEEIIYERDYMERCWEIQRLSQEDRAKELLDHERYVIRRRMDILRHQMALEKDPGAFRVVDGPKRKKPTMQLDLVKAAGLGMLDLVKAIVPTEHGTKVELRSPDAAMDNLAKWRGMLTSKVDVTSGGEKLPSGVVQVTVVPAGPPLASTESEIVD